MTDIASKPLTGTALSESLTGADLSDIRDAVPTLDLFAIRSLRRAGFKIVRETGIQAESKTSPHPSWNNQVSSAA